MASVDLLGRTKAVRGQDGWACCIARVKGVPMKPVAPTMRMDGMVMLLEIGNYENQNR